MQLAAIDIGTNSIHMIVVQVRADLSFEVIDREKEMVRLGAGGLNGRRLTDAAIAAGLQTLSKFKRIAESRGVDEIIAGATSAVREAKNGGDFLRSVQEQIGLRVRVISGPEEARLIHIAAGYGVDMARGTAVVIDIGGGSVEVTRGTPTQVDLAESFKLGVIRMAEQFVTSDPISGRDERRLVKHITRVLGDHLDTIAKRGFDRVVGTSGTILSLGALAAGVEAAEVASSDELRNVRVSAKAVRRLRRRLTGMSLSDRMKMPGLEPRRADLAVGGVILLDTILRRLGAEELTLCDLALREGLVLDYVRRNRAHIAKLDRYPDLRRRSVVELGERCAYMPEHADQVARLALLLFDRTRSVHELGDQQREWLEYAALLHDVGVHISYERHHLHSYYLVKNGDLRGFEPEEIDVVGLIARYHRRATPKKSHREFAALRKPLRRAVRTLSAILRVAEALDRSHARLVTGLDLIDRSEDALLRLHVAGDAELELWAAQRHAAPLEKVLGKVLRFESAQITHAEQSDHTARVSGPPVRRGRHRRVRQDDPARPAREVADRRRPPRVRDRMELVGAREGGDEGG